MDCAMAAYDGPFGSNLRWRQLDLDQEVYCMIVGVVGVSDEAKRLAGSPQGRGALFSKCPTKNALMDFLRIGDGRACFQPKGLSRLSNKTSGYWTELTKTSPSTLD